MIRRGAFFGVDGCRWWVCEATAAAAEVTGGSHAQHTLRERGCRERMMRVKKERETNTKIGEGEKLGATFVRREEQVVYLLITLHLITNTRTEIRTSHNKKEREIERDNQRQNQRTLQLITRCGEMHSRVILEGVRVGGQWVIDTCDTAWGCGCKRR